LSEKAQQLIHNKEDASSEKPVERKISVEDKPVKDYEKRGSKDLDIDKGRDRYGHSHNKNDNRRDMGGYNNRGDRTRQGGGRWGSNNDGRRDNKTPERDVGTINRTHTSSENTGPSNNKAAHAELDSNRNIGNDRNRTDVGKETSPGVIEKQPMSDSKDKEVKPSEYERPRERERDNNEKRYRTNEDSDLDSRGNPKNNRGGRERSGHGVYQPRYGRMVVK